MRLSELIGALSSALDITEGQPPGHAARSCLIGMRLADALGLDERVRSSLFYALLLKDAGCSTNASRVAALFGNDDRAVKQDRKLVDHRAAVHNVPHLLRSTCPDAPLPRRARQLVALVRHGAEGSRQLHELRCERGAEIARSIELDEATAAAIRSLDEHWDGGGYPDGLAGEAIPLLGRLLCLAQTVEVFHANGGPDAALDVARSRRGSWFDPALVDALEGLEADAFFWADLAHGDPRVSLEAVEPEDRVLVADDARLDRVATAFARVVDAKSPYTARHSEGVARIAGLLGAALGFEAPALRDLRRAALLHDLGKLGVSSSILDKPGRLTEAEWAAMRRHPALTARILDQVPSLRALSAVAAAHHERLDGTGYHLGLGSEDLDAAARVLAVADVAEALSAERPYRAALPPDEVLAIMRRDAGQGLDREAFAALEGVLGRALDKRSMSGEEAR